MGYSATDRRSRARRTGCKAPAPTPVDVFPALCRLPPVAAGLAGGSAPGGGLRAAADTESRFDPGLLAALALGAGALSLGIRVGPAVLEAQGFPGGVVRAVRRPLLLQARFAAHPVRCRRAPCRRKCRCRRPGARRARRGPARARIRGRARRPFGAGRRRAAGRPWPGSPGFASRCRARTASARARARACRIWGTSPGWRARRSAGDGGPGPPPAVSPRTARTRFDAARAGACRTGCTCRSRAARQPVDASDSNPARASPRCPAVRTWGALPAVGETNEGRPADTGPAGRPRERRLSRAACGRTGGPQRPNPSFACRRGCEGPCR